MQKSNLIRTFGGLALAAGLSVSNAAAQTTNDVPSNVNTNMYISSYQRRVVSYDPIFNFTNIMDVVTTTNTTPNKTYVLWGTQKLGGTNIFANRNYRPEVFGTERASTNSVSFSFESPVKNSYFFQVEERQ